MLLRAFPQQPDQAVLHTKRLTAASLPLMEGRCGIYLLCFSLSCCSAHIQQSHYILIQQQNKTRAFVLIAPCLFVRFPFSDVWNSFPLKVSKNISVSSLLIFNFLFSSFFFFLENNFKRSPTTWYFFPQRLPDLEDRSLLKKGKNKPSGVWNICSDLLLVPAVLSRESGGIYPRGSS